MKRFLSVLAFACAISGAYAGDIIITVKGHIQTSELADYDPSLVPGGSIFMHWRVDYPYNPLSSWVNLTSGVRLEPEYWYFDVFEIETPNYGYVGAIQMISGTPYGFGYSAGFYLPGGLPAAPNYPALPQDSVVSGFTFDIHRAPVTGYVRGTVERVRVVPAPAPEPISVLGILLLTSLAVRPRRRKST